MGVERSGKFYHLIGFYVSSNGAGFSRRDYLEGKVDIDENGTYERTSIPSGFGYTHEVAFNLDVNASPRSWNREEVKMSFKHWHKIGRPTEIEKVLERTEKTIFLKPESVLIE